MPVEFIGMISTRDQSETRRASGPVIDRDYLRRFARAHEDAGFDRVLIGYGSSQPDGTQVAAYTASQTDRLGFLIAHRPGFVFPTLAARMFATLDQFAGGRIAVHIITGGSDGEQRRDGDFLDKDSRYARTDEYLDILNRAWTSDGPFDYEGQYYQLKDFHADVRSAQQPRIPLYFGGSSEAAYRVGAKHADVFALWGEPLAETAEQIASVRQVGGRLWPFGRAGDQCVVPAHPRPDGGPGVGAGAPDPGDDPKEHELFRESVAEAVIWPGWLQPPKRWVAAVAGRCGQRRASRSSPLDSARSGYGGSWKLHRAGWYSRDRCPSPPRLCRYRRHHAADPWV